MAAKQLTVNEARVAVDVVQRELEWAAKRVHRIGWDETPNDPTARGHYANAARVLLRASGMDHAEAARVVDLWTNDEERVYLLQPRRPR